MIDSLKPKEVQYVEVWYQVLIKTYETKLTQTDDFDTEMTRYLDNFDRELEASDIIESMKFLGDDVETAFDMAVLEKTFSSEDERNEVKRRVIDKLMIGSSDHHYVC